MKDELGKRMKEFYEQRSQTKLTRKMPVIIRLDGVAFHTLTKNFVKPFDSAMVGVMQDVTLDLCRKIQGCKLGYVQSDEISLLLTDFDDIKTDAWFDWNVQKICSVSASIASIAFDRAFGDKEKKPYFDSRCFNVPKEEVCNYFIWRQKDATRNSVNVVAQQYFSNKELDRKKITEVVDMLFVKKGIIWNALNTELKRGSCAVKDIESGWRIENEIPIFTQDRNYVEKHLEVNNTIQ